MLGQHFKTARYELYIIASPWAYRYRYLVQPRLERGGPESSVPLAHTIQEWDDIFAESASAIDICAFQDGQIHYNELPEFHEGIKRLGDDHGVTIWSNVESFDRDMPIKFPPANWPNLRLKLAEASKVAEKIITFEFAHFMSPNSCYPAAHKLFERYSDFIDTNA